jgi:oxepin-CoA hydrolase/3-oxo-5,6-dehydrosuberyl-CoA semialdehyde dehydrogenase
VGTAGVFGTKGRSYCDIRVRARHVAPGRHALRNEFAVGLRRRGVAVHINAFNFPGWGLCEKLACAVLAGMPVLAKPATATALVAHRLVQLFAPVLPPGVLQLLVGPAGALLVGRTDARPVTTLAQPWS